MPDENVWVRKSEVLRVAKEVAEEQGWCKDGMKERLDELGIEIPKTRIAVTIPVYVNVIVEVSEDDENVAHEIAETALSNLEFDVEISGGTYDEEEIEDEPEIDNVDVRMYSAELTVLQ